MDNEKLYTYNETMLIDQKKNQVIETLLSRADEIYGIILQYEADRQLINPNTLKKQICMIEERYKL